MKVLVPATVTRGDTCRHFKAIPSTDPVTVLSFMTAIKDPSRFRRSRHVATYFRLTSRRRQSCSTIDVQASQACLG